MDDLVQEIVEAGGGLGRCDLVPERYRQILEERLEQHITNVMDYTSSDDSDRPAGLLRQQAWLPDHLVGRA